MFHPNTAGIHMVVCIGIFLHAYVSILVMGIRLPLLGSGSGGSQSVSTGGLVF